MTAEPLRALDFVAGNTCRDVSLVGVNRVDSGANRRKRVRASHRFMPMSPGCGQRPWHALGIDDMALLLANPAVASRSCDGQILIVNWFAKLAESAAVDH